MAKFDYRGETQRTILDLVTNLRDDIFTLPEEQGDLNMVEFFFKRLHPDRVMEHVIKHVLPHKLKIEKRDEKFFINNKGLFSGLPEDRVVYYSNIVANGSRIGKEYRKGIWEYFDALIALAEGYQKNK